MAERRRGGAWRGGLIDRAIALAILLLLAAARVWDPTPVQTARVRVFDLYQNIKPSQNRQRPVVIVDLDEDSLKTYGQWPWPRTLVAQLVERLAAAGAVAVAFDIVFAEPDRMSPSDYAATMPGLPDAVRATLKTLPGNDARLGEAFGKIPVVVAAAALRGRRTSDQTLVKRPPIAILGQDPKPHLIAARNVLLNVPELQKGAQGTGMITHYAEIDGVVRRVPALYRVGDTLYPTLAIELIRVAIGNRTLVVRTGADGVENIVFSQGDGASIVVPTDRRGRLWVHFTGHDPGRYVSAGDVLAGRVPADRLRGRLILVGTSATGLLDIRATPLDRQIPGVEVHAELIENILFQDHISRPYYADSFEFFVTAVLALLMIGILPALGASRTLVSFVTLVGIVTGVAWLAYSGRGLLFDLTFPLGASFVVFLALAFLNYRREERQRQWVRGAFTRYLSPAVVAQLASQPDRLNLGGEMRPVTLLFSDIRGFTTLSERFDAAGLTQFMNRYLTPMTDAILAHRGTIDKYMGDAIMAFWNAPLDDPDHARNGCRAALAMLDRLAAFNRELADEAAREGREHRPVAIGIGLNSAVCCVGNMGSEQRFDYSVLGDGVNLASRLEGLTKVYGVAIIAGEETRALAPDFAALEIDLVQVKGKTAPSRIFAVLGGPDHANSESFRALAEAQGRFLAAYRTCGWDEAELLLAEIAAAGGGALAGLVDLYRARIAEFRIAPPPSGWDGAFVAETK